MISPIQFQHLLGNRDTDRSSEQRVLESFEALFIAQMVRGMREAITEESEHGGGFGKGTYMALMDQNLAEAISRSGGIGLRAQLEPFIHAGEPKTASQQEPQKDPDSMVNTKEIK